MDSGLETVVDILKLVIEAFDFDLILLMLLEIALDRALSVLFQRLEQSEENILLIFALVVVFVLFEGEGHDLVSEGVDVFLQVLG